MTVLRGTHLRTCRALTLLDNGVVGVAVLVSCSCYCGFLTVSCRPLRMLSLLDYSNGLLSPDLANLTYLQGYHAAGGGGGVAASWAFAA